MTKYFSCFNQPTESTNWEAKLMSDDPFELAKVADELSANNQVPEDDNPLTDIQLFQVG